MTIKIKLNSNPFQKNTSPWVFFEICHFDFETGYSSIIFINELIKYNLQLGNGGSWCRSDGSLGKYFNINRVKKKGKIISVQLVGYKKNTFNNFIKREISDFYKKMPCRILNVKSQYVEIDHKDGRKDNYEDHVKQKKEYFQPLHKTANDAKRQHCKECKNTGYRFNAKKLGFSFSQWIGPLEYQGSCIGCFWYDPCEFNAQISLNFKKIR